MSATARFALPLLFAGQAQKELYHNEALTLVDAIAHACVEAAGVEVPPADPEPGTGWIVGSSPEGDWAGAAGQLAVWTAGGWRFVIPRVGMCVWVRDQGVYAQFLGDSWRIGTLSAAILEVGGEQVVGARQAAIAAPDGGTVVDEAARTAIVALLGALQAHGLIDTPEL